MFLFTWPGLTFAWGINARWFFIRSAVPVGHVVETNSAMLLAGILEVYKSSSVYDPSSDWNPHPATGPMGFFTDEDPGKWLIGYDKTDAIRRSISLWELEKAGDDTQHRAPDSK